MLTDVISQQCEVRFISSFSEHYGYEYSYTTIKNYKEEYLTIHVSSQLDGYGPDNASAHLKAVLEECNPYFAGMTGVCAGDKRRKVELGDLVLANCAFRYDDLMTSENSPSQCPPDLYCANIDSTYFDIDSTNFKKVYEEWKRSEVTQDSTLYITPMACVTTVRRDEPFHKIQALVPDTLALDMEGASFYKTVSKFSGLHSLVVKGVCDYADSEKNDNDHERASKISAEYMVCFIKEYVTSELAPAFSLSTNR